MLKQREDEFDRNSNKQKEIPVRVGLERKIPVRALEDGADMRYIGG